MTPEIRERRIWEKQGCRFDGHIFSGQGTPIWTHWRDFVKTWELSKKSVYTVANVGDAISFLCLKTGRTSIERWFDTSDAFNHLHQMRKELGWSPSTFNSYRKNLNTFFAFLLRRGLITENPIRKIEKMRERQKNYSIPEKSNIGDIFIYLHERKCTNELQRKRDLLFFRLLLLTGARPQELLMLKLDNVHDRKSVCIEGIKLGGKPRSYLLTPIIKGILIEYIREVALMGRSSELDQYLFLGAKRNNPWSYAGIRKLIERIRANGIGIPKEFTCYSFRRFNATELYKKGLPLERISKYLGHTRTATTMRYIQNLPELNSEAVELLGLN